MKFDKRIGTMDFVIIAVSCFTLGGCGGVYNSVVQGFVTLDGKPVPRGTVSFSPTGDGPTAFGQIQSDGSYSLNTGREEGLPTGQYRVSIVSNEPPTMERTPAGGPPPPGPPITPVWYRSPSSSGLEFNIESGSNDINLQLTSTPPAGWKNSAR